MKKVWSMLISMKLMFALVLLFAVSIAAGTFIENDYGAETAWALIYGARWFEVLHLLLAINLVGNILRFKIYQRKKLPTFIFHLSFLVILLGAAITRYAGYEGVLHIREGQSEYRMLSSDSFLQMAATKGGEHVEQDEIVRISSMPGLAGERFCHSMEIGGKTLEVRYKGMIKEAVKTAVEDPNGAPIVAFVIPTNQGPEKYFMNSNEVQDIGPMKIYFDKQPVAGEPYLHIFTKGEHIYFTSNMNIQWMRMADRQTGIYQAGVEYPFETKRLYNINGLQMVPKAVFTKGVRKVIPIEEYDIAVNMKNQDNLSALIVDVSYDGMHKEVALMGKGRRYRGFTENFMMGDTEVSLAWGSKQLELPFKLHLRDFVMQKYPGSMSPSSYESHVTLIDEANGVREPYRIYMNHTLDYGGFLFFQSSYDPDEMGTVLSVNHDPGKWPTYIGYIMLTIGMFLNFFNPNGRFGKLARSRFEHNTAGLAAIAVLTALFALQQPAEAATTNHAQHGTAYQEPTTEEIVKQVSKVDRDHADLFGTVLVQGRGGRIKPFDTIAIDYMNKIHGATSMFGLDHNQIILGMASIPNYWQRIDMIKTTHPKLKKLLGMDEGQKYFAYMDVFDQFGRYILAAPVQEAHRKRPAERDKYDKELIKVDERVNIAHMVYAGDHMRIFPLKGDPNNTWYSPGDAMKDFPVEERGKVQKLLQDSYKGLQQGLGNGDWSIANKTVDGIKAFQKEVGAAIIPAQSITAIELLYNKLNIFERLYPVYLLSGLLLLVMIFIRLAKPSLNMATATKIVFAIFIVAFIAHTFSLGMRWYISGHAPWSNGYEAMLYIAWTVVLAGLLFAKQSEFSLSTTGVLAGLILFVAHLSWLDPQITNMVPVLKSYWLTIHVSVITASYGFLALSALLGFISLILFIMMGKEENARREQIITSIKEATRVSEMSMIIGLSLVTVGNFLGGVWANESWGRYWGWDPKETWALVTILVYTAVVHMRFIPGLQSVYAFSVASLISYSSVIMTYFGVNYYLSGLHSYASGDPVPVPTWVYYAVAVIFVVIILAYRNADAFGRKGISLSASN